LTRAIAWVMSASLELPFIECRRVAKTLLLAWQITASANSAVAHHFTVYDKRWIFSQSGNAPEIQGFAQPIGRSRFQRRNKGTHRGAAGSTSAPFQRLDPSATQALRQMQEEILFGPRDIMIATVALLKELQLQERTSVQFSCRCFQFPRTMPILYSRRMTWDRQTSPYLQARAHRGLLQIRSEVVVTE